MAAQIAAHGRLVAEVQTRTTGNGNQMAMARIAVNLPCRSNDDGQATLWLAVTAFGKQADFLARHNKGDLISVSGSLNINMWTGNDGQTHSGYQVLADSVISARTVRGGGGRKAQASKGNDHPQVADLDDDLPF
ncbi:single-stranded DNA-binding protein [Pantoea agglomerans]|uniref:Single-stranded DNA-binding protein n=1 Tax=Enterobacter agglomerans TaxID=549 RepID=A0ACC5PV87_ENTAG|nr:single-stranded DNA-binding protein [Pantoea agglomerans]MBD8129191.1 single-stranded DNA-binding protein [Pantoea agglomerans]MBD8154859.1 single-stranded DNA-binding protein [Pantoea agglomerans]MBD8242518.1 single-stranded DNA-binding protein [Pantoea agglomerans]WVL84687.1 single-stranded DNA-binding protein [Pantoea agglomerans]